MTPDAPIALPPPPESPPFVWLGVDGWDETEFACPEAAFAWMLGGPGRRVAQRPRGRDPHATRPNA